MTDQSRVFAYVTTAANPGAIAMIQLSGPAVQPILLKLTKREQWPIGRMQYVSFDDIDDGLAVILRDDWAQLMPHGGLRVVRKILDRLAELNVQIVDSLPARDIYPEATSELQADMLLAMSHAASPVAVDLLAKQTELWQQWAKSPANPSAEAILATSKTLDKLIQPPTVAVVGQPNVGKSTLTNRMLGKSASIVADLPGTTRDWVAALTEIEGIAVRWLDTPGLRESNDPIEQNAIELSRQIIVEADVAVAMRDCESRFPDKNELPREADYYVMNKTDQATENLSHGDGSNENTPLPISAATGENLDVLQAGIVGKLGLKNIGSQALWAFSERLKELVGGEDWDGLRDYING